MVFNKIRIQLSFYSLDFEIYEYPHSLPSTWGKQISYLVMDANTFSFSEWIVEGFSSVTSGANVSPTQDPKERETSCLMKNLSPIERKTKVNLHYLSNWLLFALSLK